MKKLGRLMLEVINFESSEIISCSGAAPAPGPEGGLMTAGNLNIDGEEAHEKI